MFRQYAVMAARTAMKAEVVKYTDISCSMKWTRTRNPLREWLQVSTSVCTRGNCSSSACCMDHVHSGTSRISHTDEFVVPCSTFTRPPPSDVRHKVRTKSARASISYRVRFARVINRRRIRRSRATPIVHYKCIFLCMPRVDGRGASST